MSGDPTEARGELARIARELRAHVEWQMATGGDGYPIEVVERHPSATREAVSEPRPKPAAGTSREVADEPRPAAAALAAPVSGEAAASVSGAAAREPPERRVRLAELAGEVRGCQRCALHAGRTQTVFARGSPAAELCFVGEGPGADEDQQGLPFVGKAGQLLDRMIAAMGYERDDVYVCNIVKCRPPGNRKPEPDEMAACKPYLREQLELVSPKVIVALGATAVEGLLGMGGGITRLRGQWKLYRAIPVMPTFHPAFLLRNPAAKREVWSDLQAVLAQLGRGVSAR